MDIFQVDEELTSSIREMADSELLAMLDLHEELEDENGIELYIYLCLQASHRSSSIEHLQLAVDRAAKWIEATPSEHRDRDRRAQILDYTVAKKIQSTGDSMNDSHDRHREAQDRTIPILRSDMEENLASGLFSSFEATGNLDHLRLAIEIMESLVSNTPASHPRRATRLALLGGYIENRYERTRRASDLHRGIEIYEAALEHMENTGEDYEDQRIVLIKLGYLLAKRAEKLGSGEIGRAIEVIETALALTRDDDAYESVKMMQMLSTLLKFRFHLEGRREDLYLAIDYGERCMATVPHNFPEALRARIIVELANGLGDRYTHTNEIKDLERAIELNERALAATPSNSGSRPNIQRGLAKWLGLRFLRFGQVEDLDRSISVAQAACLSLPAGHPARSDCLDTLGNKYGDRYEHFGDPEDLDQAIKCIKEAVSICGLHEPGRPMKLSNLANWLGVKFERTGDIESLNTAIDLANEAAHSPFNLHKLTRLGILGTWLVKRFELTGAKADLDRAIDMKRKAIDNTPSGHIQRAGELNDLGALYGFRFKRTRAVEDLRSSIQVMESAIAETPEDHPLWPNLLTNLSVFLRLSYEQDDSIKADQLDRCIDLGNKALKSTPTTHTFRFSVMLNLGNQLRAKYQERRELKYLIQSVSVLKQAVVEVPSDHAIRGTLLVALGESYEERTPTAEEDLDHALKAYEECCNSPSTPPQVRVLATREAARIHASRGSWESAYELVQHGISLLPALSPRRLLNSDRQHIMQQLWGLASMAAALAFHAGKTPYQALRVLERGRNIIAHLMMGMRSDNPELENKHPKLASEFSATRKMLDHPATMPSDTASWVSQSKMQFEAEKKFNTILETIRSQTGFENFLDAPSLEDCLETARLGPIVILNLHALRCDAILIKEDGIALVELHDLMVEVNKEFRSTGRLLIPTDWMWEKIASPVLEKLGYSEPPVNDNWPHVWWIPTSDISRFPIHTAGLHFENFKDNVIDRVMSSYSTSVTSLIHARRMRSRAPKKDDLRSAVLVAMEKTPGYADLYFASQEVQTINTLCPKLGLTSHKPPPRRKELLDGLTACNIFHFAGHGDIDEDNPSQSGLVLNDGILTVADLWENNYRHTAPYISYLSACSTGTMESPILSHEGIHLISGFQLAGFRHVVGTFWEVSDSHCVDVATVFYKGLIDNMERNGEMTDLSVCQSLHKALRTLRAGRAKEDANRDGKMKAKKVQKGHAFNHFWMPYVHFGP